MQGIGRDPSPGAIGQRTDGTEEVSIGKSLPALAVTFFQEGKHRADVFLVGRSQQQIADLFADFAEIVSSLAGLRRKGAAANVHTHLELTDQQVHQFQMSDGLGMFTGANGDQGVGPHMAKHG